MSSAYTRFVVVVVVLVGVVDAMAYGDELLLLLSSEYLSKPRWSQNHIFNRTPPESHIKKRTAHFARTHAHTIEGSGSLKPLREFSLILPKAPRSVCFRTSSLRSRRFFFSKVSPFLPG